MTRKELALDYFSQKHYHCSQSVFAAYAQELGLTEEQALRVSAAFGCGGRKGELCGACVGALMVIGMRHGQYRLEDTDRRQTTNDRTIAFMDAFTRANGACRCSDLLGHDVATSEGFAAALEANLFRTRCADIVASAVELLEQVEG